jgi:hypothetical protein
MEPTNGLPMTLRLAEIAHTTPDSMLACMAAGIEIDEDAGHVFLEINPAHPDVVSAWDPKAIEMVNEMDTIEAVADDRSTVACSLTIVWADTRDFVLVECPVCDCVRPMAIFTVDASQPGDDQMVLICNDCAD